jgi:GNAT superfamily N-acetyltransferase
VTALLRALHRDDLPAARTLLAAACAFDPAAAVADEKLFGPAPGPDACDRIGAFDRAGELLGVAVASDRWLRLLAVAPDARRRGIGTALLDAAERAIAARAPRARTMDQPGNYLAPGVAAANGDTIAWLERRGYARREENSNLHIALAGNPRVAPARAEELARRAADRGYHIRRARPTDRAPFTAAVALAFGRAWGFEVDRALDGTPPAVHVATAVATGELAAFAAHDGNNRGLRWFGPAATFEAHRGIGLGEALLIACLVDIAGAGLPQATIAWIGPRAFYEKAAGVAGDARFVVLDKELGG